MRHILVPSQWRVGRQWPFRLPIEHPVRLHEFSQKITGLMWNSSNYRASLQTIFEEVARLVQAEIQYYYEKRQAASRRAKAFRFAAWLSGSLGILTPIVLPLWAEAPKNFLSWGYLAVALSGISIVADKVFSGSEAHARFVTTQLKLEYSYEKFLIESQILMLAYERDQSALNVVKIMEKVTNYFDVFHDSLGAETTAWKESLANVKQELIQQTEALKPKQT